MTQHNRRLTNLAQQAVDLQRCRLLLKKAQAQHMQFVAVVVQGIGGGELRLTKFDYAAVRGVVLHSWTDPDTGDVMFRTVKPDASEPPTDFVVHKPAMTEADRLSSLVFNGMQQPAADSAHTPVALFTDAVTGSTFAVHPGETVGTAFDRLTARYRASQAQSANQEANHAHQPKQSNTCPEDGAPGAAE